MDTQSVETLARRLGSADEVGGAPGRRGAAVPPDEWVVIPIPFKDPLLGTGIKGGLARLYRPDDHPEQPRASAFGVGGLYAEGGSWALFGADRRYWGEAGRWRSTLAGGAGDINYDLTIGGENPARSFPVKQRFSGGLADLGYRLLEHLWLSGGVRGGTSTPTIPGLDPEIGGPLLIPQHSYALRLVSLEAEWDSRNDEFYPTRGRLANVELNRSLMAVGADADYASYKLTVNGYHALNDRSTIAWRAAGQAVTGDAPFFALPWYGSGIDLRGYTPGVYIGKSLIAAQAEWRQQLTEHLGAVAFAGSGGVFGKVPAFKQDSWLPGGGIGLRWRLTDEYRVNLRVDYGWGKGDQTLLISAGEAF